MTKRLWSPTYGKAQLFSPEGDLLWEDPDWIPNALADEGEQDILNDWLLGTATSTKFLACLNMGGSPPTDTTTMATMTESATPGSNAYNRQQVLTTDWAAPVLNAGDYQTTAPAKTFGPITTGAITVSHVALVTTSTGTAGKFLNYLALSSTTTIAVGQSLVYTLTVKAQ